MRFVVYLCVPIQTEPMNSGIVFSTHYSGLAWLGLTWLEELGLDFRRLDLGELIVDVSNRWSKRRSSIFFVRRRSLVLTAYVNNVYGQIITPKAPQYTYQKK